MEATTEKRKNKGEEEEPVLSHHKYVSCFVNICPPFLLFVYWIVCWMCVGTAIFVSMSRFAVAQCSAARISRACDASAGIAWSHTSGKRMTMWVDKDLCFDMRLMAKCDWAWCDFCTSKRSYRLSHMSKNAFHVWTKFTKFLFSCIHTVDRTGRRTNLVLPHMQEQVLLCKSWVHGKPPALQSIPVSMQPRRKINQARKVPI